MSETSATQKRDLTLRYLKDMTTAHLSERSGALPLREILLYLATLTRSDALISRALAELQSSKAVDVGADHIVRLRQA